MRKAFALFFSYLFHPLWMPLIVFGLAMWLDPLLFNMDNHMKLVWVILIINVVAPGISFVAMMKFGLISSAEIHKRRERTLPFLLMLVYFVLSYFVLKGKLLVPEPVVLSLFAALIVAVLICFLITLKWKVSIHSMASGGLVGTLVALSNLHNLNIGPWIVAAIIVGGCVASSRIILKAHSPAQTYVGFLLGCLVHILVIQSGFSF